MVEQVTDTKKVVGFLENFRLNDAIKPKERKKVLRKSVSMLRKQVQSAFKSGIRSNRRKSDQAVKTMVYKNGLGANVSLNNSRSKGGKVTRASIERTGGVSGTRRKRPISARTRDIESYWGKDRAFILRFINAGTSNRVTTKRIGRGGANRGSIANRGFFRRSVDGARVTAEDYLREQLNFQIYSSAEEKGQTVSK